MPCITGTRFVVLLALMLCGGLGGSLTAGPLTAGTKVVLVTNAAQPKVQNILSLVVVQLSGVTGVELLEREEIDRVLKEHELALSGLMDSTQAIKVGKLLAADLIAVVTTNPKATISLPMSIMVFDARTGVRYHDQSIPTDAAKSVQQISDAVTAAIKKRSAAKPPLKLSVAGIRTIGLPDSQKNRCEALTALIERRLLSSDSVTILDRTYLARVTKERKVAPDAHGNELLASVQQLWLEFEAGADGNMVVRIIDGAKGAGKKLAESLITPGEEFAGIDLAITRMLKALRLNPPRQAMDLTQEALRLLSEAEYLNALENYSRSIMLAESALALAPKNRRIQETCARLFTKYASNRVNPKLIGTRVGTSDFNAAAGYVRRAAELLTLQRKASGGKPEPQPYASPDYALDSTIDLALVMKDHIDRKFSPGALKELGPASEDCDITLRKLLALRMDYELAPYFTENQRFSLRGHTLGLDAVNVFAPTLEEWHDHMNRFYDRALRVLKVHGRSRTDIGKGRVQLPNGRTLNRPAIHVPDIAALSYLFYLQSSDYRSREQPNRQARPRGWDDLEARVGPQKKIFEKMQKHPHAQVRFLSEVGLMWVDQQLNKTTGKQAQKQLDQVMASLAHALDETKQDEAVPQNIRDSRRMMYYDIATNAIVLLSRDADQTHRMLDRLAEMMLKRRDVAFSVVHAHVIAVAKSGAIGGWIYELPPARREHMPSVRLLRRSIELMADGKARVSELERPGIEYLVKWFEAYTKIKLRELENSDQDVPDDWYQPKRLMSRNDIPGKTYCLGKPIFTAKHIYVVALQPAGNNNRIRLLRMPVEGGDPVVVNELILPRKKRRTTPSIEPHLRNAQLHAGSVYVATPFNGGIAILPVNGNEPRRLTQETSKGMPSNTVDTMAVVDGNILALTSGADSYVAWYDATTRQWTTVASASRAQKKTTLDYSQTYFGWYIYDKPRQRILFSNRQLMDNTPNNKAHRGVFAFDIKTKSIQSVAVPGRRALAVTWAQASSDRLMLGAIMTHPDYMDVVKYDFAQNRWQKLVDSPEKFGPKDPLVSKPHAVLPPFVQIGHDLWCHSPFGYLDMTSGVFYELDRPKGTQPADHFFFNHEIRKLWHDKARHRLILSDFQAIWAIDLPKPKIQLENKLAGHWPLDSQKDGKSLDKLSGQAGTLSGGASMQDDEHRGRILDLDGKDDLMIIPHHKTLEVGSKGSDFTVACWVKMDQGPTKHLRTILQKGKTDENRTFAMFILPDTNRIHYCVSTTSDPNARGDSFGELSPNRWTHLAMVKKGDRLLLYIDGLLDGMTQLKGDTVSNTGPIYVGKTPWHPSAKCRIDDLYIYDRALRSAEIGVLAKPVVDRPHAVSK